MDDTLREEILKIAREVAREVIDAVREDRTLYQPPKTIAHGLQQSMGEELTASVYYQMRAKDAAKRGDHKTANLYNHIAAEENRHYEQYNKRLIEIT